MLSINFKNTIAECENYCNGFKNGNSKIKGIVLWIERRVKDYLSQENLNLLENKNNKKILLELKRLLTKEEIEKIIKCDYNNLEIKSNEYQKFKKIDLLYKSNGNKKKKDPVKVLNLIFNYSEFRGYKKTIYNGFLLSQRLGIECCPYCNRNYTTSHQTYFVNVKSVKTEKHVFPEFDHFYPKTEHPVIALSFYNLIPSCNICNTHYKNDRGASHLFHPYTINSLNKFRFVGFPSDVASLYGSADNISIDFEYFGTDEINEKLKNSIEFFGIKDIYEKCHTSLIRDIIYKKIAFGQSYMKHLENTYKMSFEDSYRVVFETNFEDEKLHKRPFSKLKKDIFLGS